MLIDIHLHTKKYSPCSSIELYSAVAVAKEKGLDGICITDHNVNAAREEAERIAKETSFFIMVGMEVLTYEGDLLIFGLPEPPIKMLHVTDLIMMVKEANGIAIAAHPFRDNQRGLGYQCARLPDLSGVEVLNGRTSCADNDRATLMALEEGLTCLGGSDAHTLEEIGRYSTWIPHQLGNEAHFIQAVKENQVMPVNLGRQRFNYPCSKV